MSVRKTVTIVGGGVAGLSAAVFLSEKNFSVNILEAAPKFGGRAYSYYDREKKQFFDNGQHILAGWYENTFDYLKLIGSYEKLNFQKSLEINFINTQKDLFRLKCPEISPPLNLIIGLLTFDALNLKDKFALKNLYRLLRDDGSIAGKCDNVSQILKDLNQTDNLMKYFWNPFILAVFNTIPDNVNAEIFTNVLKLGFIKKDTSVLIVPEVNLNELLTDSALRYFERKKVDFIFNQRAERFQADDKNNKISFMVTEEGKEIHSDYYISAVPYFAFGRLFDERVYAKNNFKADELKSAGIVSVHLFLKEDIDDEMLPDNSNGMTGLVGTIVQWIFKRSSRHLSLVISASDDIKITEMTQEDIYKICINDLEKTLKNFDKMEITDYRVIKEKRATFIPDTQSLKLRPKQKTGYSNLFIAGDWTDTGLPATIESAIKSSKICADLIMRQELMNQQ